MKRILLSTVAVFAFAAVGHADELSDIQAQSKQIREQNQALTKRLADLEKRQQKLEQQPQAAAPHINPADAMAADLPYKAAVKAPAPVDNSLCWHGVCLYGNFDMGVQYEQHGSPSSPMAGYPLNSPIEKQSWGSQFFAAPNQMSTSFIGLRGKQEIGDNLYAVFNLQTLFNPASGMNANGIGAIVNNNGLGQAPQLGTIANSYGDSSKAGQMFNNAAYFGVSSPTYGTLTIGRQSALTSDAVVNYDPLSGSNAWSLIVNEGATGGGGVTETRIFDNSFEYRLNVGPVRLAVETQLRDGNNSGVGNAVQGDVGFDYMGLSMDLEGGKIYDAVSFAGGPLSTAQVNTLTQNQVGTVGYGGPGYAINCNLGCLPGVVSDNTQILIAARYTIGAWKFYGGYEFIDVANPNNPLQPGAGIIGGYAVGFVNNNNFVTDKHLNIFWVGAKYAITPTLDIAGSYYGVRQNFFTTGAALSTGAGSTFSSTGALSGGSTAAQLAACAANSTSGTNCAGGEDMIGITLDWRFARQVDLYAGIAYSQRNGGTAGGFITSTANGTLAGTVGACSTGVGTCNLKTTVSTFDPGIGLRYQF